MKLTTMSVGILLDEIKSLERMHPEVQDACRDWLELQDNRKDGMTIDPWTLQRRRTKAEAVIDEYRQKLATVYDFMGDRGLVNFIPTGVASDEQRIIIE